MFHLRLSNYKIIHSIVKRGLQNSSSYVTVSCASLLYLVSVDIAETVISAA